MSTTQREAWTATILKLGKLLGECTAEDLEPVDVDEIEQLAGDLEEIVEPIVRGRIAAAAEAAANAEVQAKIAAIVEEERRLARQENPT